MPRLKSPKTRTLLSADDAPRLVLTAVGDGRSQTEKKRRLKKAKGTELGGLSGERQTDCIRSTRHSSLRLGDGGCDDEASC